MNKSTPSSAVHRSRLFSGVCLALVPTGMSFALLANVLGQLKEEFILTNANVGFIAGAAIWGMAISLLVVGPLIEGLGLKRGTQLAFIGHLCGILLLIAAAPFAGSAPGFWLLMLGAIVLAMGNGMIEVSGNPLTAALYPENKTAKLNWFHAFFPIGILTGSLIGFLLNQFPGTFFHHWTFQIGIILVPVIVYGLLVLPQSFPRTENAEAGLPVAEMFRFTFTQPLMYAMLLIMAIAVSVELGAGRWIPEVFARLDVSGILLLSWISLIMVVLRLNAHFFVQKFSPPGLLTGGGLFMALGLLIFGTASGGATAFLGATSFGLGVTFFFPSIVGIVSERLPRTGSLGIVLTCGIGLAAAGGIGTPGIGGLGDMQVSNYLNQAERRTETITLLKSAAQSFPLHAERARAVDNPLEAVGFLSADVERAQRYINEALNSVEAAEQAIIGNAVPQALRAILSTGIPADVEPLVSSAGNLLGPAEGYAGQRALLMIAWLPLLLTAFFGVMYVNDRRKGGYKAVPLSIP
jgi:fucose permease